MKTREIATMKKVTLFLFLLVFVFAFAHRADPWAVETEVPDNKVTESTPPDSPGDRVKAPDIIEIDAITSATTRYLPVRFHHQDHAELYGIECKVCHTNKPGGDLKEYYHSLCLGCHKIKKEGVVLGPSTCFTCHQERH